MQKRKRLPWWGKVGIGCVVVLLAPLIVVVLIVGFLVMLYYYLTVIRHIIDAVEEQPGYWLTWHDVKRRSGCKTFQVIEALTDGTRHHVFTCQFRDAKTLERLRRHYPDSFPRYPYPLHPNEAIFFEFRIESWSRRPPRQARWGFLIPALHPTPSQATA